MEVGASVSGPHRHARRLLSRARFAPDADRRPALPRPALAYLLGLALAAGAVLAVLVARADGPVEGVGAFAVLATAAAVSGWLSVQGPGGASYALYGVFLVPLVLVCPPELVALGGLAVVPRFVVTRQGWAKCVFNWSTLTLELVGAWAAFTVVAGGETLAGGGARVAAAACAAAVAYAVLSHVLVAPMLRAVTRRPWRELGVFAYEPMSASGVFAALGIVVGAVWTVDPWLVPLVLGPLVLLRRALHVPALRERTTRDSKTGLFNTEHFDRALALELGRATRTGDCAAVLMVDLDLLREINNRHGHLAGDAVLHGLAQVLRGALRERDVAARFGGEEFSILLPGASREQALAVAERVRATFAASTFQAETTAEPLRATVSIGVAVFPDDGSDPRSLLHGADVAVYRAKALGRDRVVAAAS
jgi:diguanylate cyclase (GGDEF)-like protein